MYTVMRCVDTDAPSINLLLARVPPIHPVPIHGTLQDMVASDLRRHRIYASGRRRRLIIIVLTNTIAVVG